MKAENRMTTTVVAYTSLLDGQVTRFSSLRTSVRNVRKRSMCPPAASRAVSSVVVVVFAAITAFARTANCESMIANLISNQRLAIGIQQFLNPVKLAGQEGIEPPTPGFGDRCSTN